MKVSTHYAHTVYDKPREEPRWCQLVYRMQHIVLAAAVIAVLIAIVVNLVFVGMQR